MVHALRDVGRVLVDGGTLLDLRPLPRDYPLELVTTDGAITIGRADTTGRIQDAVAADAAVTLAVDEGLFSPRSRAELDVHILWDTVRDLKCYMATRESTRVTPSYDELERTWSNAGGGSNAPALLRASRRVMLAAFDRTQGAER